MPTAAVADWEPSRARFLQECLRFMDKTPARPDVRLTSRNQCDEWRRRIPKIRRAYVAQDWCNVAAGENGAASGDANGGRGRL